MRKIETAMGGLCEETQGKSGRKGGKMGNLLLLTETVVEEKEWTHDQTDLPLMARNQEENKKCVHSNSSATSLKKHSATLQLMHED